MPSDPDIKRHVAIPELRVLQELRYVLARGGQPPLEARSAEDCMRIATFQVVSKLLDVFRRYKAAVEGGERCRLVERERVQDAGRVVIELIIEPIDARPDA